MARKKKDKASKPAKRAPEPESDVLEEVETGGAGIDEGIVFTTFALLAGAVYMIYTLLDGRYPDPIS
jgi:hypothetical protein